jgi:hypothetical protein
MLSVDGLDTVSVWTVVIIVVAVIVVAGVVYLIYRFRPGGSTSQLYPGAFSAMLWRLASLMPSVAAIITVFVFVAVSGPSSILGLSPPINALASGFIVGLVAWLLSAWRSMSYATPESANPKSYGELRGRFDRLDSRLCVTCPVPITSPPESSMYEACAEAYAHRNAIARMLNVPVIDLPSCLRPVEQGRAAAIRWVSATGYIDLWTQLHRAEEALIAVEPVDLVLRGALTDELRLSGSKIVRSDDLLSNLRRAVAELDPGATIYLKQPLTAPATSTSDCLDPSTRARTVLQEIRNVINEYRDQRWEGLVRTRNRLINADLVTSIVTYVALAFLIGYGVPKKSVFAAAIFFLVGAAVGCIDRLRHESQSDVAQEEDYGLSTVRMFQVPLFSGLAAVGGVLIIALLPFVPISAVPSSPTATATLTATAQRTSTPTSIATPTGMPTAPLAATATAASTPTPASAPTPAPTASPPTLDSIFDLDQNRIGIVIAMLFGLAPSQLIGALQAQIDRTKGDLKSTEAPDQAPGS